MIKSLNNKETAILLEDIKSTNGFIIPKGTKIKMINKLAATAIVDILPYIKSKEVKFLLYYRKIIKSEHMFASIKPLKKVTIN